MLDSAQKVLQQANVKYRLCHGVLGSRRNLIFKAPDLLIEVGESRIRPDPDHKSRAGSDRIPTNVQTPVQIVHDIDQADCVYIEDGRCVGEISHSWRIAPYAYSGFDSHRRGSQEVTLDAQNVAIATGVVQDGINSGFP